MDTQLTENYHVAYLTAEDLRSAASIMFRAYHDDPFFRDALGFDDLHRYEQKLRVAIREELNELWQQEQTLVGLFDDGRLLGVICVVSQPDLIGEGRYWHWRLKMLLGAGWQSTQALIKKDSSILACLPQSRCGVIQFICVSPTEQRNGHGHQLVQAITHWCDEQPDMDGLAVFAYQEQYSRLFNNSEFIALTRITIGQVAGELLYYHSS